MDSLSLTGQNAMTQALQKQTAANAAGVSAADHKKTKKAATDFEAFFVGQMMENMTEGLETDDYFGGGHGEEMWRSMLNQEYGKEVAKSGRLGIANTVMTGMLRAQEERTAAQMGTQAVFGAPQSANTAIDNTPAAQQSALAAAVPAVSRSREGM